MQSLPKATIERLTQLPLLRTTWQGDLRPVHSRALNTRANHDAQRLCVLWMDVSQPSLRALEPVTEEAGFGAVVRVLLQAIEQPRGQQPPGRPQRLVVCNRELQFFLRGALQGLDIKVEYGAKLPLVDDVVQSLEAYNPELEVRDIWDSPHAKRLVQAIRATWRSAPWMLLAEYEVVEIKFELDEPHQFYLSTLGMEGLELGLLLYRSLESLEKFRKDIISSPHRAEPHKMEEIFLNQDCFFLTFNDLEESEAPSSQSPILSESAWPELGSIHPLEGMRDHLSDDELMVMVVILEALNQFIKRNNKILYDADDFPSLKNQFRILNPLANPNPGQKRKQDNIAVTIQTRPDVTLRLLESVADPESLAAHLLMPDFMDDLDEDAEGMAALEQIQKLLSLASGRDVPLGLGNPNLNPGYVPRALKSASSQQLSSGSRHYSQEIEMDWLPEGTLVNLETNLPRVTYDMIPDTFRSPLVDYPFTPNSLTDGGSVQEGQRKKAGSGKAAGKAAAQSSKRSPQSFPLLALQTSQPKAKALIDEVLSQDRPIAMGVMSSYDQFDQAYDLLVLYTAQGRLLGVNVYWQDDPFDLALIEDWHKRTKAAGNRCSVAVFKGATGKNRGMVDPLDLMRLWDIHVLSMEDLLRSAVQAQIAREKA